MPLSLYCPGNQKPFHCLIVNDMKFFQIFDNSPAAKEGSLEAGDELTGVNRVSIKGKTKTEVARMIQESKGEVTIQYNKLHADPKQGKTLDIGIFY